MHGGRTYRQRTPWNHYAQITVITHRLFNPLFKIRLRAQALMSTAAAEHQQVHRQKRCISFILSRLGATELLSPHQRGSNWLGGGGAVVTPRGYAPVGHLRSVYAPLPCQHRHTEHLQPICPSDALISRWSTRFSRSDLCFATVSKESRFSSLPCYHAGCSQLAAGLFAPGLVNHYVNRRERESVQSVIIMRSYYSDPRICNRFTTETK